MIVTAGLLAYYVFTDSFVLDRQGIERTKKYARSILGASDQWGIPASTIAAIICVESSGNPTAQGAIGERGLMQITKGTFEEYRKWAPGFEINPFFGFVDLWDPVANIYAGTGILKMKLEQHKDFDRAIRAYNGNPENVLTAYYFFKVSRYDEVFKTMLNT